MSGPAEGDLLVIGWGGTYGSITTAVQRAQRKGLSVAQAHLRYLNPMPRNTGEVLKSYKKVLMPELNAGQLAHLLRADVPGGRRQPEQGAGPAVPGQRD